MTTRPFQVPPRLRRLEDIAYNLWWSWDAGTKDLFRRLDPGLWFETNENLVLYLKLLPAEELENAAADPVFLAEYDAMVDRFDQAINTPEPETWVGQNRPELSTELAGYFSAEFGLHPALPIYSGGLGVLAGDHIKEASDLGLPLVAISLFYRHGYLTQRLTHDGWQEYAPSVLEPNDQPVVQVFNPDGTPLTVDVEFDNPSEPIELGLWKVQVGRVPLYLLDADLPGNPEWVRGISNRLYGGDKEYRLRQEIILGIGGVRALRALEIEPTYWHANEGHAAFHMLERVREHVSTGANFDEAAGRVRATTVFTTHTPVPAGHDIFPPELMDRYFQNFWPLCGLTRSEFYELGHYIESAEFFNLTALSMRLSNHRNAVSLRHGAVTRSMWQDVWPDLDPAKIPVTSVTNGVHMPTWISGPVSKMLDQSFPDWRDKQADPAAWDRVLDIPDEESWRVHLKAKRQLLEVLRERSRLRWVTRTYGTGQLPTAGLFLQDDVLTIGFARRFATYKRATLLFNDVDRLASILCDSDCPVQIIFAGKSHPADDGGKQLIQEIMSHAKDPRFAGRIAFAEDYDMGLASYLVAGVDIWLNNPRAPLEASGTSGMKAGANGVPNLSLLDGWWIECWRQDNSNGWGIQPSELTGDEQDQVEADAIYDILENQAVPAYYNRDMRGVPVEWVQLMKQSMRSVTPEFSARRMLIDYMDRMYAPAAGALQTA